MMVLAPTTSSTSNQEKISKVYHGNLAVKKVEEQIGRPLNYAERRVVIEEGFVDGCYGDTKGINTCGVGQTGKYRDMSFEETFKAHQRLAERLLKHWATYPLKVRAELIQAAYRGDLQGSPKFVKLMNEKKYAEAADEFLNNKEYRTTKHLGIKRRMAKVANAVRSLV